MAQCIDIRRQGVSASDTFLLDTNVAIDIATPLSPKATVRQRDYSKFIERALTKGAGIAVAVLSFFEMSNVLERQVFESEAALTTAIDSGRLRSSNLANGAPPRYFDDHHARR